jgi:hypothetical protein
MIALSQTTNTYRTDGLLRPSNPGVLMEIGQEQSTSHASLSRGKRFQAGNRFQVIVSP